MGQYDGEWKRVDGERFYLVIKEHLLFRQVLIRDGPYEYSNDTLQCTTSWKPRQASIEKHVMNAIDKYMSEKRSKERQIDSAVETMDEVYRDDW